MPANRDLTLFFDSQCPICSREIDYLASRDKHSRIEFVDLHSQAFAKAYPAVDFEDANRILYGIGRGGEVIRGLDVTIEAWRLIGKGWLVAPLNWRLVRPLAEAAYRWFARHRQTIASMMGGQRNCRTCDVTERH